MSGSLLLHPGAEEPAGRRSKDYRPDHGVGSDFGPHIGKFTLDHGEGKRVGALWALDRYDGDMALDSIGDVAQDVLNDRAAGVASRQKPEGRSLWIQPRNHGSEAFGVLVHAPSRLDFKRGYCHEL